MSSAQGDDKGQMSGLGAGGGEDRFTTALIHIGHSECSSAISRPHLIRWHPVSSALQQGGKKPPLFVASGSGAAFQHATERETHLLPGGESEPGYVEAGSRVMV